MNELRNMWRGTWWAMAKGKQTEYQAIKATPVLEFWALFDLWRAQTNREVEAMKEKSRNSKR